jgi:hypothetical protein
MLKGRKNKNKNCGIYGAIFCTITIGRYAQGMMDQSSPISPKLEIRRSIDVLPEIGKSEDIIDDVIKSIITNQIEHELGLTGVDISFFMEFLNGSMDPESQFYKSLRNPEDPEFQLYAGLISKGLSKDVLNLEFFENLVDFYNSLKGDSFERDECIAIGLLAVIIATKSKLALVEPILNQALKIAGHFSPEVRAKVFKATIVAIIASGGNTAILGQAWEIANPFPPAVRADIFMAAIVAITASGGDTAILGQAWEITNLFPPAVRADIFMAAVAAITAFGGNTVILAQAWEIADQFSPETGANILSNIMAVIVASNGNINTLNYILPTALDIIQQLSLGNRRIMIRKIIMGLAKKPDIIETLHDHRDEILHIGELDQLSARGLIECLVMGEDIYTWENTLESVLRQIE